MTIIFFAIRFYPLMGGVEKHVLEISRKLMKKGIKVVVITEKNNLASNENYQSDSSNARFEGIDIISINTGKEDKFKKFRIWIKLLKYFNTIRSADIVHCHDIFFWYLPFRFIFPLKKVYTTFHGYEGNNIPDKKAILMHKLTEKLSRGNICVGEFLRKWYGTKPTFITYGAVEKPKEFTKSYDKNLFLFLGRLEEETGILEYLKAFKELVKKDNKLRLVVLGDGSLKDKAIRFTNQNKLNVKFKGFVKNIADYLPRTSFVFTSRYLGILESLMSKKYVLAVYNNEIKKDYLKMTPFSDFISISKDSIGIQTEIEKYLKNNNLKSKKIEMGYEWVKDKSWDKMVNLYLDLWELKD